MMELLRGRVVLKVKYDFLLYYLRYRNITCFTLLFTSINLSLIFIIFPVFDHFISINYIDCCSHENWNVCDVYVIY